MTYLESQAKELYRLYTKGSADSVQELDRWLYFNLNPWHYRAMLDIVNVLIERGK